MAMYVLRLIRTPDKEYKSPRSLGVRVNESRLYLINGFRIEVFNQSMVPIFW